MSAQYISNVLIDKLLNESKPAEKVELSKIIKGKDFNDILSKEDLERKICGSNGYLKNLHDVASKLNIPNLKSYYKEVIYFDKIDKLKFNYNEAKRISLKYTLELEQKIILHLLEKSYDSLNEVDKENFDKELQKVIQTHGETSNKNLVGTAGLLALGNMGGFATYTFLTSAMSVLSFGTLSFGAYTAATSMLSVVLGPVGWTALGIWAIFKLGQPNYKELIPIVLTVGLIRQRIMFENKEVFNDSLFDKFLNLFK